MKGIEVVRGAGLRKGRLTRGIVRNKSFETKEFLFARSRIAGGTKSGWHHHGFRDVYGYLVSGSLRFYFGDEDGDSAGAGAGDFFHIPVGLVHRDVNPDPLREAIVVNVFLGVGLPVVNTSGPSRRKIPARDSRALPWLKYRS